MPPPLSTPAGNACTPRMAALLNTQVPQGKSAARSQFLGTLLTHVENRAPLPTHAAREKAQKWGVEGTFDTFHRALQPHAGQLEPGEREALRTLEGLGAVYRTEAPRTFAEAITRLDALGVRNAPHDVAGTAAVASGADAIDALEADLFREIGLLPDERLAAGFCHVDDRVRMARALADTCRAHGMEAISEVCLRIETTTRQEVLLVWDTNRERSLPVLLQPALALRTHVHGR